jgi:hypothetical protein
MGPLVSRRLADDPDFHLEDWRSVQETRLRVVSAYAQSLLNDLAGRGDNLHAVLAPEAR